MVAALAFDAERHAFTRFGKPVPSVTQVLRACGLTSRWGTTEARDRGTRVHRALDTLQAFSDAAARETLEQDDLPFYEAGIVALTTFGIEVLAAEELVDGGTYAGWLDLRVKLRGENDPYVIDFKTGSLAPSTRIQLTAYAAPQPFRHKRAAIVLKPNGSPKLVTFDHDMQDLWDWRACLAVASLQRAFNTGESDD